jgi:uncharacterized membrane protein (UPF0127 family)/CheY-like chemotaxis protein
MAHRAGALVLRREDDGRVLCERCVLADTVWRRTRGLIGRGELDPGDGIVLRPSWSIHTFFLRSPIDVVFVDVDQVIVRVVPRLGAWKWATCRHARDVVELRAGTCERLHVQVGQRLAWAAQPESRPSAGPMPAESRTPEPVRPAPNGTTRVLLGTQDDRFLRLARFLLTRHQFEVEATKRLPKTVDLVEKNHPDVVVIDATASDADAARTVAAIEALDPYVALMVVCDGEPPRWTAGLKVAEKWEALETLTEDVRLLAAEARTWT